MQLHSYWVFSVIYLEKSITQKFSRAYADVLHSIQVLTSSPGDPELLNE